VHPPCPGSLDICVCLSLVIKTLNFSTIARLSQVKNLLLDLLFPVTCLSCQRTGAWLCASCLANFPINKGLICPGCCQPSLLGKVHAECKKITPLAGLVAAASWRNPPLKELIHSLKYHYAVDAKIQITLLLVKKIITIPLFEKILTAPDSYLIPVPLHQRKKRKRGFNQSELLAGELANHYNLSILADSLIKKRQTKPQIKLKGLKRRKNLLNAYSLRQQLPAGAKHIILLDDVMTTGATLNACAQAIKEQSPKVALWGLVVAKG
jgi:competence protein ComFC